MQEVIRVFLIEDNRLLRGGLVTLLNGHPDIAVIAAVEHAEGALPLIRNTRPHVVLMDPSLEDDSYDLVVRLREAAPEVKVIVMDLLPEEKDVIDFTEAGASGFIAKDATEDELLLTIRSVAAGGRVVPAEVTDDSLLAHIARHAAGIPVEGVVRAVGLTKREQRILGLISEGTSNRKIAQRLHLSVDSVHGQVHNILDKLALRGRLEPYIDPA